MPNLTSVGLTAGAATSGTGTVSTIDNLIGTAGTGSAQVLTVQGNASGTAVPVSLASTTVTGTVAVTESGTWTVQPGNTANTTAWKVDGSAVNQPVAIGALDKTIGTGGSATQRVSIDTSQLAALSTTAATMSAGYQLVALPSDQVKIPIHGDTASGSSDANNPVKIGGLAKTANPTAVTDGQRVNGLFDKLGKQIVVGAIRDLKGNQLTTITASTSETTVATAVASTFLDVYGVIVENTSATGTKVTFKDATAGTTRFEIYVPPTETRGFMLPVDSAVAQAVVNNNWTATCGTSVSSVVVSIFYVKNI